MEDLIETDEILVFLAKRLKSRDAIYELSDKEKEEILETEAA